MMHGDLSNRLLPRVLIVFEGVIATLPDARRAKYDRAVSLHRYRRAMECYEPNAHAVSVVWDWAWRRDIKVDVVSFIPFLSEVERVLEKTGMPYSHLWFAKDADVLAGQLAYMPDVVSVLHADETRPLAYGSKSLYVTDTQRLEGLL